MLMRRVDHQAGELESLRAKNEELAGAVDRYKLQQKVSRPAILAAIVAASARSLAGLED